MTLPIAGLKGYNFIKEKLQHRCFPVNNAKFFRTPPVAASIYGLGQIGPENFLCNVVSAVFRQRCQKQPFADVLQNKCS